VIAKLRSVEEEANKCLYWIALLIDAEIVAQPKIAHLMTECNGIVAVTVASIRTLRTKQGKRITEESAGYDSRIGSGSEMINFDME
jgi:hypothetical protein